MKNVRKYIALLCSLALFGLAATPVLAQSITDNKDEGYPASDTYYYHYEYDTVRLPRLLNTGDSVALLSWVRFSRQPGSVFGSLVLPKDRIDTFQKQFRHKPLRAVQHEYIVPHPTGWWSLHFSGSRHGTETIRSLKSLFSDSPRRFRLKSSRDRNDTRWPKLTDKLRECGRTLGQFFHVTLNCTPGETSGTSAHSMSYAFFQETSEGTVVIGDLVTGVDELGTVIRLLYNRNMKMMSLAYNQLSKNRRRYFIHFAGNGERQQLAAAVKKLVEITRDDSESH